MVTERREAKKGRQGMNKVIATTECPPRKGVKTKLFGFTLVLLGVLDSLLFLRGGQAFGGTQVILIGSGLLIWLMGATRQRHDNFRHEES